MDGVEVSVAADSVSPSGQRLTTLLLVGTQWDLETFDRGEFFTTQSPDLSLPQMLTQAWAFAPSDAFKAAHHPAIRTALSALGLKADLESVPGGVVLPEDVDPSLLRYAHTVLKPYLRGALALTTSNLSGLEGLTLPPSTPSPVPYDALHLPFVSPGEPGDLVALSSQRMARMLGHLEPVSHVAQALALSSVYSKVESTSGPLSGWSILG